MRTPEEAGLAHLAFTTRQTHTFTEPACPTCGQQEHWAFRLDPRDGLWRLLTGRCDNC